MTDEFNKPSLGLPLGASYNARGIAGFTNTITNAIDQRKINSIYEPVKNATTGGVTLYLAKRPGVADVGSTYGTTGQVAYLWDIAAVATTTAAANRKSFVLRSEPDPVYPAHPFHTSYTVSRPPAIRNSPLTRYMRTSVPPHPPARPQPHTVMRPTSGAIVWLSLHHRTGPLLPCRLHPS